MFMVINIYSTKAEDDQKLSIENTLKTLDYIYMIHGLEYLATGNSSNNEN